MKTVASKRVIVFGIGAITGFLVGAGMVLATHAWLFAANYFPSRQYPLWHAVAVQTWAEQDETSLEKRAARRKWIHLLAELDDLCEEYPRYRNEIWNNIGITHARLAVLDESAGRPESARRQWAAACEYLRLAGWRECDNKKVRRILIVRSSGFS